MIDDKKHIFLVEKLDSLLNCITEPHLSELCGRFVGQNGKYRKEFLVAPAAKSMHHGYPGGLLEHSIEVAKFCLADYELLKNHRYESLDIDLMLAASLLHDIAKIKEYEIVEVIDGKTYYAFTVTGKMIGHLCLSAMWAYSEIEKIEGFPHDLQERLIHILLSHHGRVEWGTAILPKTKEAEFFHMADHRSATIAKGY
jgi:3'-5' exoribonuclease